MLDQCAKAEKYSPAIVRAAEQDLPAIRRLLESAAQWLASHGMHNWEEFYTAERISEYYHNREIYCARLKNEIIGSVTLNLAHEPGWYSSIPAIYVNALAVSPSHHGHGIGSSLLLSAEEVARQRGYECVRFDAVADFHSLASFYGKRGYEVVGEVQRRFRYIQYEKKVSGNECLDNY